MYNKRKFNKINDKKVLHKVKKQWITISLALFMMIGSGAIATHINASANATNQRVVNVRTQNNRPVTINNQASQLHNKLVNNANVRALRLGSNHTKRNNVLKNRFKRSNNGKSLKKSGYVNTIKYNGHFVFNKYAPNDKRAVVPKRLNLKYLSWAKGRFGQLNLTLFTHKHYGWIKLSNRSAKKYNKALNNIYKNYKRSRRINHGKKSYVTYISVYNYKKLNRRLKNYRYSMRHGYKRSRKYSKTAYDNLKNKMKYLRVRSNKNKKNKNRKSNKKQMNTSSNIQQSTNNTNQVNNQSSQNNLNTNIQQDQSNQGVNTSDGNNIISKPANNSDTTHVPSPDNSNTNVQQDQSNQDVNISSDNNIISKPANNSDTTHASFSDNSNTNMQPSDDSDNNSQSSDNTLTPTQISTYLNQYKQQTFNDINQDRQANGAPALIESPILDKLSALRAQQLITNFSHYSPQGKIYFIIDASQVGLHLTSSFDISENIASSGLGQDDMSDDPKKYNNHNGYDLANMDEDSMMNYDTSHDNGHRNNILSKSSKYVGIGTSYDKNNGMFYIAEDFSTASSIASDQKAVENDQQVLNKFNQDEADINSKLNEIGNNEDNIKNQLTKDQQILNTDKANKLGSQKLQQDQQNVNNDKTNLWNLKKQPVPINANFQAGQFYEDNLREDGAKLQKDEQYINSLTNGIQK